MSLKQSLALMAKYNQWINERVYQSIEGLSHSELTENRGAFFGSIIGTLNHILVGDIIWLKRFAQHSADYRSLDHVRSMAHPSSLSEIVHAELDSLKQARITLDKTIVEFISETTDHDFESDLNYINTKGTPFNKNFGFLVQHFFNHQTHHRGQVTTLLNQLNIDVGTTDLLTLIPESDMI